MDGVEPAREDVLVAVVQVVRVDHGPVRRLRRVQDRVLVGCQVERVNVRGIEPVSGLVAVPVVLVNPGVVDPKDGVVLAARRHVYVAEHVGLDRGRPVKVVSDQLRRPVHARVAQELRVLPIVFYRDQIAVRVKLYVTKHRLGPALDARPVGSVLLQQMVRHRGHEQVALGPDHVGVSRDRGVGVDVDRGRRERPKDRRGVTRDAEVDVADQLAVHQVDGPPRAIAGRGDPFARGRDHPQGVRAGR